MRKLGHVKTAATLLSAALLAAGCAAQHSGGKRVGSRISQLDGEIAGKPPKPQASPSPAPPVIDDPAPPVPSPVPTARIQDISQDFVTSRWTVPISDGWWPSISDDGRYVLSGIGESILIDRTDQSTRTIASGNVYASNWLDHDTYTYIQYGADSLGRRYTVARNVWNPVQTADDPGMVAGNAVFARDGHWTSFLVSGKRLSWDGRLISTGFGGMPALGGDWLVQSRSWENDGYILYKNGIKVDEKITPFGVMGLSVRDGYVTYTCNGGQIRGVPPGGQDTDISVSPWAREGAPYMFTVAGKLWMGTFTWNDALSRGFVLIRPYGEKAVIPLEAAAVGLSIVATPTELVVAANDDKGRLLIQTVPLNAKRYVLAP